MILLDTCTPPLGSPTPSLAHLACLKVLEATFVVIETLSI